MTHAQSYRAASRNPAGVHANKSSYSWRNPAETVVRPTVCRPSTETNRAITRSVAKLRVLGQEIRVDDAGDLRLREIAAATERPA